MFACGAKTHEIVSNRLVSFVAEISGDGPAADAEREITYGRPYLDDGDGVRERRQCYYSER